jgi:hypothetical protein
MAVCKEDQKVHNVTADNTRVVQHLHVIVYYNRMSLHEDNTRYIVYGVESVTYDMTILFCLFIYLFVCLSTNAEKETRYIQYGQLLLFQ